MTTTRPSTPQRSRSRFIPFMCVVLVLSATSAPLRAQHRTAYTLGAEQVGFFDRVALASTLEIVLFGVAGISDAQRGMIEALEQELRDSVAHLGTRIRDARRTVRVGWPAEPELIEREINAIAAARQRMFDRLRDILPSSQHAQFDRNLLMIGDSDIAMWINYAKPYAGTNVIGASVP